MGSTMMAPPRVWEPPLPLSPPCSTLIAAGVDLVENDEGGQVWINGRVTFVWASGDDVGRRVAAVSLVETGAARQREVAEAFGVDETTVWRWRRERERSGVAGLVGARPGPRGPWKLTDEVVAQIVALDGQGHSAREIARRLEVSDRSVRDVLAERGRRDAPGEADVDDVGDADRDEDGGEPTGGDDVGEQLALEPLARPDARTGERQAARAGLLHGAAPQICEGAGLPLAGALLVLPALESTGLVDAFAETFADQEDKAAFYDLRALVLTATFAALVGEPRAEGLTRLDPVDLGRLVGLDRAPEVKTMRRRIGQLAGLRRSDQLLERLARRHLDAHPEQGGLFYVDGHVRAYHGKYPLPKAHLARMRISMPATVDTWICDSRGDGVLVWTSPPGASLVAELRRATDDIRELVGPDAHPTIVFDRGGWSPKLFDQLHDAGFDILTYRKNPPRPEPASAFEEHAYTDEHGETHTYRLADRPARIYYDSRRRYFACRQITRDCGDGHQTPIITTRDDPDPAPLAHATFGRWREENFFRYTRTRFALDALDSYATVADDPQRTVPNPAKKTARTRIRRLEHTIASGEATAGRYRDRPGLAKSLAELDAALDQVRGMLTRAEDEAAAIPARVPLAEVSPDARLHDGEHKRLVDAIRMATYNAESSLARALVGHYARARQEARSLLREAFRLPGDIHVADGQMHVTLNPASAPRRTRALAALCETLTDTRTTYPGADLELVYTIKTPPDSA